MGMSRVKKRRLADAYCFEGFRPQAGKVRGMFGKPKARILPLERRSKKHVVGSVALYRPDGMTAKRDLYETCLAGTHTSTLRLTFDELAARNAAR